MKNIKTSIWAIILTIGLIVFSFNLSAQIKATRKIYCSHPELCRLAKIILTEEKINDFTFETLVNITGDPHEYEPSSNEIKKLIISDFLITGPQELNPWITRINFQRIKLKGLISISLLLDKKDFDFYPNSNHDSLSHFWLYPKIFCNLKEHLFNELKIKNIIPENSINKNDICHQQKLNIEKELSATFTQLKLPIVLTHDALLPLLNSLNSNPNLLIIAIKGSGHHHEANPQSVKKLYDALKAPKVIWIEEKGIHIPQNILAKKRSTDLIVTIDTSNSVGQNYFQTLINLNALLKGLQ